MKTKLKEILKIILILITSYITIEGVASFIQWEWFIVFNNIPTCDPATRVLFVVGMATFTLSGYLVNVALGE
jgi:hypothetical protein